MASDKMRFYRTFYGILVNDWQVNFGSFANHHELLVDDYISDGCSTATSSSATLTTKFLYPHHIEKTYFIEGVIEGHVTFGASTASAYFCRYRVTVCKMHEDTTDTELFSTGWISVNDYLTWDIAYKVGQEVVCPFWIDAWEYAKLTEKERIYVKVQSTCSNSGSYASCQSSKCTHVRLWHSNDSTWEDLKITIPMRL